MNKLFLNRQVYEFNSMTPKDAIEELLDWDFEEAFGSDAERLSDAIKRLVLLVEEVDIKKSAKEVFNETLGINCWYSINQYNSLKEVHFTDVNGKEFEAFVGEDIINSFTEDLEDTIKRLYSLESKEDLIEYLNNDLSLQCKTNDFEPESEYAQIYQFNGFQMQIFS